MTGFGKDSRGVILYDRVSGSEALGALAADDVLGLSSFYDAGNLENDFRMLRMECWAYLSGITVGEGPILFGFASGDLTDAEIEECIEAIPSGWDDRGNLEKTHRPVWPLGLLAQHGQANQVLGFDGRPIVWTKRWTFSGASGWKWWVYNLDNGALTSGALIGVFAKIYGVWVK